MRSFREKQKADLAGGDIILDYAEHKCPAAEIQYTGPSASSLLTIVESTGDMSSKIGAVGSEATDDTFSIDSSDYTYLHEMAAAINVIPNYRCVMHAKPDVAASNAILHTADAQIKWPDSHVGLLDNAVVKEWHASISARNLTVAASFGDNQVGWDERGYTARLKQIQFDLTHTTWGTTVHIYFVRGSTVHSRVLQLPVTVASAALQQSVMETVFGAHIKAPAGYRIVVVIKNTSNWFSAFTLASIVGDVI